MSVFQLKVNPPWKGVGESKIEDEILTIGQQREASDAAFEAPTYRINTKRKAKGPLLHNSAPVYDQIKAMLCRQSS